MEQFEIRMLKKTLVLDSMKILENKTDTIQEKAKKLISLHKDIDKRIIWFNNAELITRTINALKTLECDEEQIKYAMENISFEDIKNIETSVEKAIGLIFNYNKKGGEHGR